MGFSLRVTLSDPNLDTTVVGTGIPGTLAPNLEAAARAPLPTGVVVQAKRRLAATGSSPG